MTVTTREFLNTVITAPEGYFLLAIGGNGKGWNEHFFEWPAGIDEALDRAAKYAPETNVYFSSYLFGERRSLKDAVLPSRTIQADLDEADPVTLPLTPTILVQTSPGRYQGYWLLKDEPPSLDVHEILSRKLTYSIPNCDHSGWPLGRKVRLPNTLNHKYLEGVQAVQVTSNSMRVYKESDLELLPDVTIIDLERHDESFIEAPPLEIEGIEGAYELLESIKSKLTSQPNVMNFMTSPQKDRSAALWHLMCALFRAGLSRDKVFYIARRSKNNKFLDLHFHADRELAKDVLRAESTVKSGLVDIRDKIKQVRSVKGVTVEKRMTIFDLVRDRLKEEGEFLRSNDDTWYVRRDLGKPIQVALRSEWLHTLLDIEFGLNATEIEHDYTIHSLIAFGHQLPITAETASLSHYAPEMKALLLHTGKKDVLKITADDIEHTIDGSYGIVFPWSPSGEQFNPVLESQLDWALILFNGCLDNILGLGRDQALAILRVWFLFLLFRSEAISRPILALFGQPGAGKSTLFRRVYALLYGRQRSLDSVTNPENFDQAVASDPLVVLDNVDTWQPWLPDRLAQAASTSDIVKRKLYFDKDSVIMKRQAMLGITAHNPRFGREDIADRLIILNFERLTNFLPEGEIIHTILRQRNWLWGSIVRDIQRTLRTNLPTAAESPQFRIEDFARMGLWIARALGIEPAFVSAIGSLKTAAKSFLLEEDTMLVNSIRKYVEHNKRAGEFVSTSYLWQALQANANDITFDKQYRNAVFLGKKLWAMQESLKDAFVVKWQFDTASGARQWLLDRKDEPHS